MEAPNISRTSTELALKFNLRSVKLMEKTLIQYCSSMALAQVLVFQLILNMQLRNVAKKASTQLFLNKLRREELAQIWQLKLLQMMEM